VIAGFVGQGLAIGATVGSFTLFVRPISEAFEASTLEVSAGIALITLALATSGVAVGIWLDRGSPRSVMFTGCAILSSGLWLASLCETLSALALLCVLIGAGIPMLGPLATAAVVTKASDLQRGRALGIANLGVPIGGVVFALTAGFALQAWDWRATLQLFAGIAVIVGFPAIALGIPSDLGSRSRADVDPNSDRGVWTARRLLASPVFRTTALILGIAMGTTAGWSAHIAPYLDDIGASKRYAGFLVGGVQAAMGVGTVCLGTLADRRSGIAILVVAFLVQLASFAVLLGGFGLTISSVALLLSGLAAGGYLPVMAHLLAERFGSANLGRAMGLANVALLPLGVGLPMLAGALRDTTGGYGSTMVLCGALFVIGIGGLSALSRQPRHVVASD